MVTFDGFQVVNPKCLLDCISFAVRWPALHVAQVSVHVVLHSLVQVRRHETQSVCEQMNIKIENKINQSILLKTVGNANGVFCLAFSI